MTNNETTHRQALGARIKAYREAVGATQTALAAAVQLTRSSVSAIEGGKQGVSVRTLYALADALQVDPSSLLKGPGPSTSGRMDQLAQAKIRIDLAQRALGQAADILCDMRAIQDGVSLSEMSVAVGSTSTAARALGLVIDAELTRQLESAPSPVPCGSGK